MFEKLDHRFVCCRSCGLERISPQPTAETLSGIYGAHYYDAWGLREDVEAVAALKRRTFAYVLNKLGRPQPGTRLLDCGAATGFLLEVARDLGYTPYGLELSEFGAGEIARKFGAGQIFCGELQDLRFPGAGRGDFQVVTMCDYIEHVRDPRQTLALARNLVGPGGALVITSPDTGSLSHRLLGAGWTHYKVEHLFYFGRRNLTRLLNDVGFSSVTFYPLWKSLSLDYIGHQYEVYPHRVLTPVAKAIQTLLPAAVRSFPLPFSTGELLAVARV